LHHRSSLHSHLLHDLKQKKEEMFTFCINLWPAICWGTKECYRFTVPPSKS
jgi:hypothetical protein